MKPTTSAMEYLFITRRSSHYDYYQKCAAFLGASAHVKVIKGLVFPRLFTWRLTQRLNINDLVGVHVARKFARHPQLSQFRLVRNLLRTYYSYRERVRASYYFTYFIKHQPQRVILWNGMKQPNKTPVEVARALDIPVFLFENGLLPQTTVLDNRGVNALNSLPRNKDFYEQLPMPAESLQTQLSVRQPHKFKSSAEQNQALPDNYLFAPFQVPNDTQIICHSPWLKSMEDFYTALATALDSVNRSREQPLHIVLKEHPSWPQSYRELYHKHPHMHFANGNNTQALIEGALGVVTINSTVGIESLLLNTPVMTLGDACFNISGIVQHCHSQQLLNQHLGCFWQTPPAPDLLTKFLGYMQSTYLLPGHWYTVDADAHTHFAAVKARLDSVA